MILNSNGAKDNVILDVYDVYVKQKDTGKVLAMQRLTNVSLEQTANSSEIRAGKSNSLVMTLQDGKTLKVTLETPVFYYEILALQLGQNIQTATGEKYIAETADVKAGKVSLKYTPKTNSVKVYDKDGEEVTSTVTAKDVTLTGTTDGEKVRIIYQTALSVEAEFLEINAKTFPKAVELQLITEVYNNEEEHIADMIIDIDSAKLAAEFNMSKASTREGMTQTLVFDCLADASGKMGRITFDKPSA